MECSIERIKIDIEKIAEFTATPEEGSTRYSYSKEDKLAREYLINEANNLGLVVNVDGVGNIRAKYIDDKNKNKPSIIIGSHIDTVLKGGKFDGVAGVITGLEVIRVIKEKQIQLKNPVELIVFAEEEGSNFEVGLFGSKVITESLKLEDIKEIKDDDGLSFCEVLKNFGLEIDNIGNQTLKSEDVKAMIELHVEQGGILDLEHIPIGIVEAIVGAKTFKVVVKGVANHAGSTPMHLRKDALVGATEIISGLRDAAREKNEPNTVATVGKIYCSPNSKSAIASEVEFYVDIRAIDETKIDILVKFLNDKLEEVKQKNGLEATIELISKNDPVKLSRNIIDVIEESAIEENLPYRKMNSGAVHDAVMLTKKTDVGMIFVPSIDGKSHSPHEDTNYEDILLGCELLLKTVIKLAN